MRFICLLLMPLLLLTCTRMQAQMEHADSLLEHAKHLLSDSAQLSETITLCATVLEKNKTIGSTLLEGKAQLLMGYVYGELVHYEKADSCFTLAEKAFDKSTRVPTENLLDLYNKQIYTALIIGNKTLGKMKIDQAIHLARSRNDTATQLYASLWIQKAIYENNNYKIRDCLKSLERAEAISNAIKPVDSLLLVKIWTTHIAVIGLMREPEESLQKLYQMLAYCQRDPIKSRSSIHRIYGLIKNLELNHSLDVNKAISALDGMQDIVKKYYSPLHPLMARTMSEYADVYSSIGDIDRTRQYAKQANYILNNLPGRARLKYNNLLFLANTYYYSKDYRAAMSHFQQALDVDFHTPDLNAIREVKPLLRISSCYLSLNQVDSAKVLLDYITGKFNRSAIQHSNTESNISRQYANYYEVVKDYPSALIQLQKSLKYNIGTLGTDHFTVGDIYLAIGRVNFLHGQLDSALFYIDMSLDVLKYEDSSDSSLFNPANYAQYIPALQHKALVYYHKFLKSENKGHLETSMKLFDQAIEFIQQLRHYMNSQTTQQTLGDLYFDVYSGAVKTAVFRYQLDPSPDKLDKVFELIQSSKAQALLENIYKTNNQNFARIPKSLIKQEVDLQNKLALLERLLIEAPHKTDQWKKSLFATNLKLQELLHLLESQYPSYFQLKYDNRVASLDEVQMRLKENETLIEYFIGDDKLYSLAIDKSDAKVTSLDIPSQLNEQVDQLREGISSYYLSGNKNDELLESTKLEYTQAAYYLYDILLNPLQPLTEKIIIIPDGVLGYIPFEALLTSEISPEEKYSDYPYLLFQHKVTYNYASTLWNQASTAVKGNNKLLAIAPDFNTDIENSIAEVRQGDLLPLVGNIQEVEFISKLFNGQTLIGVEATKESFSKLAPHYGLIHFATHAIINDDEIDQSYLALAYNNDSLADDHLYLRDLYNSNLPAELVVLSACETGLGKLKRGEGIISLARSFAYAGANAVVTSLWSVSDKATALLMQEFYAQLKDGQGKDIALRNAKLDLLSSRDDIYAAPFYWASTIAIGDMKPIQSSWSLYWFFAIGALLLLVIARWKKR